jgi:hypothetical protein
MKLFLLLPVRPWTPWYDRCFGMVVRAKDEDSARMFATQNDGDQWLDSKLTTCAELMSDGDAGIIIRDMHWA